MTSKEIANKWQMNRYKTPGQVEGMNNREFYQQLDADISEYAKAQCIAFAEWLSDHPLLLEPSSGKGEWIGVDFKVVSSETLFEQFLTETSL